MFSDIWYSLLDRLNNLSKKTTLITPLSHKRFRISDVQEQRVVIDFEDRGEKQPLQRDQFKALFRRISDEPDGFELGRLPPNAEPYATILSLDPRFEADEQALIVSEGETRSSSPFVENPTEEPEQDSPEVELDPTIEKMMDNMGDPSDRVTCPIESCDYSHRSAASVARHVSGSSTAKHIWENTGYAGWRDFVRKHG
jgi:hypothetical protein